MRALVSDHSHACRECGSTIHCFDPEDECGWEGGNDQCKECSSGRACGRLGHDFSDWGKGPCWRCGAEGSQKGR